MTGPWGQRGGAGAGHGSLLLYPSFTSPPPPLLFIFSCLFLSFSTLFSFLSFSSSFLLIFLLSLFFPLFLFLFFFFPFALVLVKRYLHFCWKSGP